MFKLQNIMDLFFPRQCACCDSRLLGEEDTLCLKCLLHLPRTNTWEQPFDNEMAKMFWHRIAVERCCALFYFQSHSFASRIIYQLKYAHRPDIGVYLGRCLAQEGLRHDFFEDIDAIVPIPLTKRRKRQRGYNQSEEIAKGISSLTHLPIITDAVERTKFTESQTHKGRWERLENVQQVFRLTNGTNISGKHLLIVDDVCTTGATIIACCEQLAKAGNVRFSILSLGYAKD